MRAGRPAYDGPARRVQQFAGTDRQVRGRIMAVLRESSGSVGRPAIEAVWEDALQRERALDGLVADGLVELVGDDRYGLPAGVPAARREPRDDRVRTLGRRLLLIRSRAAPAPRR